MPRIIAIDYGSKRVGLAVTDPLQIIATALDTVHSTEVMSYLRNYTSRESVSDIVVGEPKHLDGSPAQAAGMIDAFVKQLKNAFPRINIVREDERFTSKMAFRTMIDSGIGREKRRDKKLVDKISAVIILQSYLERNRNL